MLGKRQKTEPLQGVQAFVVRWDMSKHPAPGLPALQQLMDMTIQNGRPKQLLLQALTVSRGMKDTLETRAGKKGASE